MAVGFQEIPEVAKKQRPRRWGKKQLRLDLTKPLSLCKGSVMSDPVYLQEKQRVEGSIT